jgi:hypothetical protein
MNNLNDEISRRKALRHYLERLSALIGEKIEEDQLMSVTETRRISDQLKLIPRSKASTLTLKFKQLEETWTGSLAKRLSHTKQTSVVLFIPGALLCGGISLNSVSLFKCQIPFKLIPEGVITIATNDGEDCLIFDLSINDSGDEIVEIELRGNTWSKIQLR